MIIFYIAVFIQCLICIRLVYINNKLEKELLQTKQVLEFVSNVNKSLYEEIKKENNEE